VELRFTVWQFVRLMVYLEETNDTSSVQKTAKAALRDAWDDVWQPLDQELTELVERDFDAYSNLMMDQDVVIENATPEQIKTAAHALNHVMVEMDQAIAAGGELEHLQNLKFERRELRQLTRKLDRTA